VGVWDKESVWVCETKRVCGCVGVAFQRSYRDEDSVWVCGCGGVEVCEYVGV